MQPSQVASGLRRLAASIAPPHKASREQTIRKIRHLVAAIKTMTYGDLPTEEEFDAAWDAAQLPGGKFAFGNDERVGTANLSQVETWAEIQKAHAEWEAGSEQAGDWLSSVMGTLGFEWV